ncbi:MAG: DUF3109 family protein [Bacteroidales bacterium]|jgi:hypothetical protein|nr:DUF3109 family protein [Bacteroidales bacterium]
MLNINNVLISEDLIEECFCCDSTQCAGMCCVEGDIGAPLAPDEIADLEDNYPVFQQYMTQEGIATVEALGTFDYDMEGEFVTPLCDDEACVYVYYEDNIAKCAIEKAFLKGEIEFRKPISCHLYPIRVKKLPDFDALNYHRWRICEEACKNGKSLKIPVYRFLKEALIRKYGDAWFDTLETAVKRDYNL